MSYIQTFLLGMGFKRKLKTKPQPQNAYHNPIGQNTDRVGKSWLETEIRPFRIYTF